MKTDEDMAALWQEFGRLAPLDDLGLQTGSVIALQEQAESGASQQDLQEEVIGEKLQDREVKRTLYPLLNSGTSKQNAFHVALQKLLNAFADDAEDVAYLAALFQQKPASNSTYSESVDHRFAEEWERFIDRETAVSNLEKNDLCIPTGQLGAPLLPNSTIPR